MLSSTCSVRAQLPFAGVLLLFSLALYWAVDFLYFGAATTFPDEERFFASARHLVAKGEFSIAGSRAWEMPGTAAFFAIPILVFGPEHAIAAIRVLQSFLLVLQSGLIGITAWRIFGDALTGRIAAVITAFYPFLVFYQGLLLSETLFNTFLVAGVAATYWWRARGAKMDLVFVLSCVCFAIATWTKATLTVLPLFILAASALGLPNGTRRCLVAFLASAILYGALLSPWWIRNYTVFGTFVPFTTSAGQNLYLGNNPANLHAGIDWVTDVERDAVSKFEAIPNELERQRAYSEAALSYIQREPQAFVRNAAKKLIRLWNIVPNAKQFGGTKYQLVTALSFGPILVMAFISAISLRRQFWTPIPIYLLFGYVTALHVVTIASLRYRLPLEPFLLLLAAKTIATLYLKGIEQLAKR